MDLTDTTAAALARALHAAGAVVTFVPGFGASQVFEAYAVLAPAPVVSFHEEVAFTVAHGASLAGRRAAVLLKTHGLAKAANSALDAVTAGVTAGFVPVLFDDPHGRHSDSIADPVRLLQGVQMPYLRAGREAPVAALHAAFETSERLQLPCALVLEADAMSGPAAPEAPAPLAPLRVVYRRDVARHVLCPPFAAYQHQVLQARRQEHAWEGLPRPAFPRVPDDLPPAWRPTVASYAVSVAASSRATRGSPAFSPCRRSTPWTSPRTWAAASPSPSVPSWRATKPPGR
jgi:TPP-dependent indolepyruvate ferredoxin oxidoreductase alpha subunit